MLMTIKIREPEK